MDIKKTFMLGTDRKSVKKASRIIKGGGIVIYPTETCYGIGVDATNPSAVRKILKLKGRKARKAISVIFGDEGMAKRYITLSPIEKILMTRFMPGPLTLASHIRKKLPVCGKTLAWRISADKTARALARAAAAPLTATSANLSGRPPAYNLDEVKKVFGGKVDAIIDGGNLRKRAPSTLVNARGRKIKILREGPISEKKFLSQIRNFRREGSSSRR
jgi:L-threonylcarbamoyladenylate synthase